MDYMEYKTFEYVLLGYNFNFVNTTFYKCTFRNVTFGCVLIEDSKFIECTFDNAIFTSCSIENVTFENCIGVETISGTVHGNWVAHCEGLDSVPLVCPKDGEFYAYKAVCGVDSDLIGIAKLRIPADAKRSSGLGRKCRCSKAEVVDIWTWGYPSKHWDMARSFYSPLFVYSVGKSVKPVGEKFNENRWDECSSGIHFFMTEGEANVYANTISASIVKGK